MPIVRLNVNVPDNASTRDIADAMARLQRELEWLLNGNLDGENVKSIGTVTGNVTFSGTVKFGDGTAIGTVAQSDSVAMDITALKNDFNALLQKLRDFNILNG